MSKRKISFASGEYYHLYNRGNSKQVIFHDNQDYQRFIYLLYICNTIKNFETRKLNDDIFVFDRKENLVSIGAYVLMPNHFHILITENIDGGISKFMQKLTTAYSMYYNKKYNRTGSLFEGRFKSKILNTDRYLKYIYAYIHLNPVKLIDKDWKVNGIKDRIKALGYLQNYLYSSYLDYVNTNRKESVILNKSFFPEYFSKIEDFNSEIIEWLSFKEED